MDRETAPPGAAPKSMANELIEPLPMRESDCPFCERTVLVYEDPPRCPLCACPLDPDGVRPYVFPEEGRLATD